MLLLQTCLHGSLNLGFQPSSHLQASNATLGYVSDANDHAGCVQSPRWHFPLGEAESHASTGGPLYLGSLPAKPAEQYFAVLPLRPPPEHKVSPCCTHAEFAKACYRKDLS